MRVERSKKERRERPPIGDGTQRQRTPHGAWSASPRCAFRSPGGLTLRVGWPLLCGGPQPRRTAASRAPRTCTARAR
eukprot:scaffold1825_cov112-Isochrysis_galbana.AAC.1